ncbi:hypothetical protein IB265_24405 [Ensifer sp. ENS10]|uniref:hypothetical protein n=1 Tax=Ensifer sp. ENS10 TaxID=2769286 RepID=UPI001781AE4F|nr:hypothetical protein [Ensifer sp. ENS10]MBD9509921.1 hypothetical protein [Ensifer sp. ENS10]
MKKRGFELEELSQSVKIYGFGSYFTNPGSAGDIDLLILHSNVGLASSHFAIACKQRLRFAIPRADITMLSAAEEVQLAFIDKARARLLGDINMNTMDGDLDQLLSDIAPRW